MRAETERDIPGAALTTHTAQRRLPAQRCPSLRIRWGIVGNPAAPAIAAFPPDHTCLAGCRAVIEKGDRPAVACRHKDRHISLTPDRNRSFVHIRNQFTAANRLIVGILVVAPVLIDDPPLKLHIQAVWFQMGVVLCQA